MGKIIGIDLGTTNSCVAVMENGEPVVITNHEGMRTTPSVVSFSKDGERMVGAVAKRQAVMNPDRTISSIKRHMGSDYKVSIDGKSYTPQEISAMILQKLKADAEAYLGEPVTEAVITCPAYFTDAQRQATKDAGHIAGLDVKRIINEPTAAALAYGADKEGDQKVMVYDLGGGTFDVSIIEMGEGVQEVLATAGNNHLGGDDFDQRIIDWLVEGFKASDGVDLRNDKMAMQRLKDAAEKAKIDLSGVTTSQITLPFICVDKTGTPKNLDVTLTRAKFNELTADLVDATMGPVRQALSDAGLTTRDLHKVLLVGGSTRIVAVQEAVKNATGMEPSKNLNPDECVAIGAAIQGGVLGGEVKGLLLLDVTPLSLGLETLGGVFTKIIERNTTIPTKKSQIFGTGKEQQITITSSTNMSKEDIDKAVREAEAFAAEDKKAREAVDIRNNADQMVFQTEKTLKEIGDKVSAAEKNDVEAKVNDLKEALKGDDIELIKSKQEEVQKAFYALSEKLYQAQQAQGGQQAGPGPDMGNMGGMGGNAAGGASQGSDPNVVDADFHEVDDNK